MKARRKGDTAPFDDVYQIIIGRGLNAKHIPINEVEFEQQQELNKGIDYEQKYKEALERARKIENGEPLDVPEGTSLPVAIFPELKESYGEKIRKHLIILFLNDYGKDSNARFAGIKVKDIIAWLEKQEEQKSSWNEEDEKSLSDTLWCCEKVASIAKDENEMGTVWYAERWLKSLKSRL